MALTQVKQETSKSDEPTLKLVKGEDNSNSLTRGTSNPSAIAMLILLRVMDLYKMITRVNAEQQQAEIKAQGTAARSEAIAIKDAGYWMGKQTIIGAGIALCGAIVSTGIQLGAEQYARTTTDYYNQLGGIDEELAPIQKLDRMWVNAEGNAEVGAGGRAGTLADSLLHGDYSLQGAVGEAQYTDNEIMEALSGIKGGHRDLAKEFKQNMDRKRAGLENKRNSLTTQLQTFLTKVKTIADLFNQGGQTGSSYAQGLGQMWKAGYDAAASVQGAAKSVAASTADGSKAASQKAADAQNGVIQALKAIRQASS